MPQLPQAGLQPLLRTVPLGEVAEEEADQAVDGRGRILPVVPGLLGGLGEDVLVQALELLGPPFHRLLVALQLGPLVGPHRLRRPGQRRAGRADRRPGDGAAGARAEPAATRPGGSGGGPGGAHSRINSAPASESSFGGGLGACIL